MTIDKLAVAASSTFFLAFSYLLGNKSKLVAICRYINYWSKNILKFLRFGLQKLDMIVNHRLLSSPMIVNQWHSEMMNQPLVPTLRPSASAPALGVDSSSPRAIDFPIIGSFGAYDFLNYAQFVNFAQFCCILTQ